MAGDTIITVIGNITGDPELRFTPSGAAVANFTVASTPRTFDRQTNEWKDGETLFMRCSVWRDAAENVAESLDRGTRVIVSGRLKSRSYETKEGEKRTVVEMEVDEVGPSLRYATAKVNQDPARRRRWRRLRRPAGRRLRRPAAGGGSGGGPAARTRGPPARPAPPAAAGRPGRRRGGQTAARQPALGNQGGGQQGGWGNNASRLRPSPRSDRSPITQTPSRGDSPGSHQRRRAPRWPSPLCASPRRRPNPLKAAKVENIDYKDTALLRKFISDRGKIRARRVTGVSVQEQRLIATAVKNAREMALLPYSSSAR